jgi:hypothetical protein
VLTSQANEQTSAFTEKKVAFILRVIKQLDAFAATEQLTDGDR